jgi:hypothetical protein
VTLLFLLSLVKAFEEILQAKTCFSSYIPRVKEKRARKTREQGERWQSDTREEVNSTKARQKASNKQVREERKES